MVLTIDLTDEATELRHIARQRHQSVEELILTAARRYLEHTAAVDAAARRLLVENADLFDRLADE